MSDTVFYLQSHIAYSDRSLQFGYLESMANLPSVSCGVCSNTWGRGRILPVQIDRFWSEENPIPYTQFEKIRRMVLARHNIRVCQGDGYLPLKWAKGTTDMAVQWPGGLDCGLVISAAVQAEVAKMQSPPFLTRLNPPKDAVFAAVFSGEFRGSQPMEDCSTCGRLTLPADAERKRFDEHLFERRIVPPSEAAGHIFRHSAFPDGLMVSEEFANTLRAFLVTETLTAVTITGG